MLYIKSLVMLMKIVVSRGSEIPIRIVGTDRKANRETKDAAGVLSAVRRPSARMRGKLTSPAIPSTPSTTA